MSFEERPQPVCLIIDGKKTDADRIASLVKGISPIAYEAVCTPRFELGMSELRSGRYAVCLIDEKLLPSDGLNALGEVFRTAADTPVILVDKADNEAWQRAVMPAGVTDIVAMSELTIPFLARAFRHALNDLRRHREHADQQRELAELTATLRLRTRLMRLALDNAKHGIAMFDGAGHLTICNAKYRDIYGFSADVVRPGISIREILEYSISLGNYTDEDAEWLLTTRIKQVASNEPSTYEQHLRDGRIIAVSHQPMPDGRSVATCEDITETVRLISASRDCERRSKQSDAANRTRSAVLDNMSRDFRESLSGITTVAQAIHDEIRGPLGDVHYKTYAAAILNSAERLTELIDSVRQPELTEPAENEQPSVLPALAECG